MCNRGANVKTTVLHRTGDLGNSKYSTVCLGFGARKLQLISDDCLGHGFGEEW
jgi:hypothetical protein